MGCIYRTNINCYPNDRCEFCGWNPEVEKARKEKLRSGEVKTYLVFTPEVYNKMGKYETGLSKKRMRMKAHGPT